MDNCILSKEEVIKELNLKDYHTDSGDFLYIVFEIGMKVDLSSTAHYLEKKHIIYLKRIYAVMDTLDANARVELKKKHGDSGYHWEKLVVLDISYTSSGKFALSYYLQDDKVHFSVYFNDDLTIFLTDKTTDEELNNFEKKFQTGPESFFSERMLRSRALTKEGCERLLKAIN